MGNFGNLNITLAAGSQIAPTPSGPPPAQPGGPIIGMGDNIDNLPAEGPTVGTWDDIRDGTAASPSTSLNPTVKVSRTLNLSVAWASDGSQRGAWSGVADANSPTIVGQLLLTNSDQAQGIAIMGATKTTGQTTGIAATGIFASPDAVGVQGWAQVQGNPRTDANCATTNANPVVNDAAITASDAGKAVSGTGIPSNSFVGTVIPGVSFRLSSSGTQQTDVNATATNNPIALSIGGGQGAALGGVFIGHAVNTTAKQVDSLQLFCYQDSTIDRTVNGSGQSFGRGISFFQYGGNVAGAAIELIGGNGAQGSPWDVGIHGSGSQYSSRTDANCATTNLSSTVNDANITAADFNKTVSGTGIPQNTVITSVTPGVSFTISSPANATNNPVALLIGYQGPAKTAFIQDDTDALYGLYITNNANHQTAGIAVDRSVGSNAPNCAVFGSNAPKNTTTAAEVIGTSADANPLLFIGNGSFSQIYGVMLRNSNGQHQWDVVKAANNIVTGTVAGDAVMSPRTAGTFFHLGGTVSTIKIGQDNTLGFFNSTSRVRNVTNFTNTAAQAASFDLPAAYTLQQLGAVVVQLIAQLGSTSGYGLVLSAF